MTAASRVSAPEALRLAAGGALLIDIRSPTTRAQQGEFPDARIIAKADLLDALRSLRRSGVTLLLFCRSDSASAPLVQLLRRAGHGDIRDIAGGYAALTGARQGQAARTDSPG